MTDEKLRLIRRSLLYVRSLEGLSVSNHVRLRSVIGRPQAVLLRCQQGWGAVPSPLHVGPPGKRSCATVCLERVLVLLRAHVSATCLICCHLVSAWFSEVLIATLRTAKCWDKTFGVIVLCWDSYSLLRHRGRFPQWGGTCTPRYCGPLG